MKWDPSGFDPFSIVAYTESDLEPLKFTRDRVHFSRRPFGRPFVSLLIRSFEILRSDRLLVPPLVSLLEISTKAVNFLTSLPIRTSLDPIPSVYTRHFRDRIQTGSLANAIPFK